TRGFWAWEPRGTPEFFDWMARNRMNLWTAEESDPGRLEQLGIRRVAGGHQLQLALLDPDAKTADGRTRLAAHPEWYGLVDGLRSAHFDAETGVNFCTSNPAAAGAFCHGLVAALSTGRWRHADALAFWMLDNGHWCECDACRAI